MAIAGRFLLGCSSTYPAGSTGGTSSETLNIEQIPSHNHFNFANTDGFATHCVGTVWGKYVILPTSTQGEVYNYNPPTTQGGGKSHNNMPPYLSVYVWKRTS